jgi:TatD DNase family protein
MFIDTHCHLNFQAFQNNLNETIENAKKAGVDKFIVPGAKLDSSLKACEIANKYPDCFASIGIHPHHIDELNILKKEKIISEYKTLIAKPKVVAIGEIGLDYYQYKNLPAITNSDKALQKELFLLQFDFAIEKNLPVILHCREAHEDLFSILASYQKLPKIVLHCFDAGQNYLEKALNLGFFIGFDGNITYPKNDFLRNLVSQTPIEKLLLETDSPYLTPVPHRGQENNPANLVYIAQEVAKVKNLSLEEIGKTTTGNALNLFSLKAQVC